MTPLSRRNILGAALVGAAAATSSGRAALAQAVATPTGSAGRSAAVDGAFDIPDGVTLLNNAGTHPLPTLAARATAQYLAGKSAGTFDPRLRLFGTLAPARTRFAALINAAPAEIALVQSTLAAENMVVTGLDLPRGRGNVVTEALHYDGALYLYRSIESETLRVRIAPARDGRIPLESLEELIDDHTRLVSVSLVSSINGHMHDLKAICDLAHARGALVYADIIQAAGAVPIDVKAANVDFCGCGSYKWLMGDCGAGFLYTRKGLLGRVIERDRWGYLQCDMLEQDPFATPGAPDWPIHFRRNEGAAGYFEIGTPAFGVLAGLEASLGLIASLGVARIQAHITGLLEPLRRELPKLGYKIMTPPGSAPILAFHADDPAGLRKRLAARKIDVKAAHGVIRVSPGVFTTPAGIERLLAALKQD